MANASDKKFTLSTAILAPLNSLFEAQVQSARSFLSFILQLGFKEHMSLEEIDEEEKRLIKNEDNLNDLDKEAALDKLEKFRSLMKKKLRRNELQEQTDMTSDEEQELIELRKDLEEAGFTDDLYQIPFEYKDGNGVEQRIEIPALALVPVQPLAINAATFDFSMSAEIQNQQHSTKQKNRIGQSDSPWRFIDGKRISGQIDSGESTKETKGIKIHIEVGAAPIPQGLSSLLTSLTQSARIIEK